jgi:hypothetical protein
MDLSNFTFTQDNIGIEQSGQYLDLHNNFDLIDSTRQGDEVSFIWQRTNEPWVAPSLPQFLKISIVGVDYYEVRGTLSNHLDEIGFFPAETLGKVDYNGTCSPTQSNDILVLRFVGGSAIAVRGRSATVSHTPPSATS